MRKFASLLAVLLTSTAFVFAQNPVKGKVTDSKDGTPLSSISVTIRGTSTATSTAPDGSFSIDIGASSATLDFSSVGYSLKSVKVNPGQTISISLEKSIQVNNEVVVTALGIKREKRSLGYATQTIGGDQLNKSGTGNPLNELSGKASGIDVVNSAGDPGGGTYVLLRGQTSITGSNQPLMVVDGVPIDNSVNNFSPQFDGFQAGGANADLLDGTQPTNRGIDINPNDIESITLLKGPAATALYGIQAASGAIVITTKKGTPGKKGVNIQLSSSIAVDKVSQLPPVQNKFSQGDGDGYMGPWTGQPYSWGAAIDTLYWDGTSDNPWDKHGFIMGQSDPRLTSSKIKVAPYDPYSFFQNGITYDNNLALSGATADGSYRMSFGNVYQTGIVPQSKYIKNTFGLSGQSKLNDKVSVSGSMNFINSTNNKIQQGSNTSGLMLGLTRTTPTFDNSNGLSNPADNPLAYSFPSPVTYTNPDDGTEHTIVAGSQRSYRGLGSYDNPYWTINKVPFTSDLNRVFGYGQINYQATDWLGFSYRLGGDVYSQQDKNAFDVHSAAFKTGAVYLINYFNSQYNSDFTINLKKNFNKDFSGSLILGQNYFDLTSHTTLMQGIGLNVPGFLDISNSSSLTNTEGEVKKHTMAFYGDAEFTYKRMLYLTITGRNEESSTLPAANNTFFYPSASLGWIFTELPSMKSNKVLSFGKLRASAAQVGKDAPVYALTTPLSSPFSFTDGFVNAPGVSLPSYGISSNIATIGNPNLKPEKTVSYEGGLDLGFLKDRISLNATYYYSKSTDVIIPSSVSYTTGFAGALLNAATLTNKGVELTLSTTPVKLDNGLRWDLNFNWSHNSNMVVSLAKGLPKLLLAGFGGGEFEVDAIPGQPYGVIYGATTPHSVLTDLNSPLLIDDNPKNADGSDNAEYGQPIGGAVGPSLVIANPNPKWIGSVISNLSYKGFTFSFQINTRQGGKVINGTRGALAFRGLAAETLNRGTATVFKGLLGHLSSDANGNTIVVHNDASGNEVAGPGAQNTIQSAYDENYWQNAGNSVGGGQEVDVEDGSYTKLKQISLTYELPSSILNKTKLAGVSLTIFANNIHTWTKYDGVDPETSLTGPANAQGMDFFNNPGTKSYGVRLNIGF